MKKLILLLILVISCNEHNCWKRRFKNDVKKKLFECTRSGELSKKVCTNIKFGPMLKKISKEGFTPLLIVAKYDPADLVDLFIIKGADVDKVASK